MSTKPGGDELAFGIDGPFGRAGHRTDFGDSVALDGNIRVSLLAAGTVDDGAVFNDDIVGHGSSLCGSVRFSDQLAYVLALHFAQFGTPCQFDPKAHLFAGMAQGVAEL